MTYHESLKNAYYHTIEKTNEVVDKTPFGKHPGKIFLVGVLGLALTGGYQLFTNPIKQFYTGQPHQWNKSYLEQAHDAVRTAREELPSIEDIAARVPDKRPEPRPGLLENWSDALAEKRAEQPEPWNDVPRSTRASGHDLLEQMRDARRPHRESGRQLLDRMRDERRTVREDFDGDGIPEKYEVNRPLRRNYLSPEFREELSRY